MTYYNPPPNPYDPALNYTNLPPVKRPTVITTLAIIGIVMAILWLLCGGFGLITNAATLMLGHNVLMANAPRIPTAIMVVGSFEAVIWLILAIVLLAACIAALTLKPWAWRVLMPWSVVTIVVSIAQFAIQMAWVGPQTIDVMKRTQPNNPGLGMAQAGMICSGVVMLVIYSALPICFLMLWRSELVRAAFGETPPGISQ